MIESPSPCILSKSTQIESGPDAAEFVGSVGWYRSWWAWASLGFRGTTWASAAITFTDFTVTCWVFGVLAEGRMGMQRESERNLFASWECAAQCHFTSRGCKALAMLYNLFSTLELPEMVQAVRCLRMSTQSIQHWIQTLTNRRNWWNGFMDSWIHGFMRLARQCNAHFKRFQVGHPQNALSCLGRSFLRRHTICPWHVTMQHCSMWSLDAGQMLRNWWTRALNSLRHVRHLEGHAERTCRKDMEFLKCGPWALSDWGRERKRSKRDIDEFTFARNLALSCLESDPRREWRRHAQQAHYDRLLGERCTWYALSIEDVFP